MSSINLPHLEGHHRDREPGARSAARRDAGVGTSRDPRWSGRALRRAVGTQSAPGNGLDERLRRGRLARRAADVRQCGATFSGLMAMTGTAESGPLKAGLRRQGGLCRDHRAAAARTQRTRPARHAEHARRRLDADAQRIASRQCSAPARSDSSRRCAGASAAPTCWRIRASPMCGARIRIAPRSPRSLPRKCRAARPGSGRRFWPMPSPPLACATSPRRWRTATLPGVA